MPFGVFILNIKKSHLFLFPLQLSPTLDNPIFQINYNINLFETQGNQSKSIDIRQL